jgi:glutathione S-transferase
MKGEHHQPPLAELNPNRLVPVLVDGDFVLTESSAIVRYLARMHGSGLYPTDARSAARVDELMAWFESNFYKDFGYQYVYPQLMPHHQRPGDANGATVEWGRTQSRRWLQVLDSHLLRHCNPFLLGAAPSVADFLGASILSLGELVGCRFDAYPQVRRWYGAIQELESWRGVNTDFSGFATSLRGHAFVALEAGA